MTTDRDRNDAALGANPTALAAAPAAPESAEKTAADIAPAITLKRPISFGKTEITQISLKKEPGNGRQRIKYGEPQTLTISNGAPAGLQNNNAALALYIAECYEIPATVVEQLSGKDFSAAVNQILPFF